MPYGDPGIMAMVISAVVGTIVGIPTTLFMLRHRIGGWINRKRGRNDDAASGQL